MIARRNSAVAWSNKRGRHKLTPSKVTEFRIKRVLLMMDMKDEGLNYDEIGAWFGLSKSGVCGALAWLAWAVKHKHAVAAYVPWLTWTGIG